MNASESGTAPDRAARAPSPKSLVLFSDGTGNSSAKLFKTNVWRMSQAIDIGPPPPDELRQMVFYDDGVGTSSFRPLALLGGVFGVGLKRNVLDLYRFVCRHYEPGDRLYAFGFSRGAFTIRVLVGLIAMQGVVRANSEAELRLLSADVYRSFRRCFRLNGNRDMGRAVPRKQRRDRTDWVVTPLRDARDRFIAWRRARSGKPTLGHEHLLPVDSIEFMGVWDTVAAYGSPISEITRAIDRWIWPLSMPDYMLSTKVKGARHALGLDDERDTFHPLLWDEIHERDLVRRGEVSADRLQQVWFAGMHSDVGGGYAEDSLAHVSLVWMAEEAVKAGLRLKPLALQSFRHSADPLGPMHDSRSGLAAYYRYQPRKIAARCEIPDPLTRIVQDPDLGGRGLLTSVRIHDSVLDRIEHCTDGYAPIVLPDRYVAASGGVREKHPDLRAAAQESVWDDVWRRRITYFLTLGVTIVLVLLPWWVDESASSCPDPQCIIVPVLSGVGQWLPDAASFWIDTFAARPGLFLLLAGSIYLLMKRTEKIETGLRDRMRSLYRLSFAGDPTGTLLAQHASVKSGAVRRLRASPTYLKTFHSLKWHIGPGIIACLLYAAMAVLMLAALIIAAGAVHRGQMSWMERADRYCQLDTAADSPLFNTADMCWRVPGSVEAGKRYLLTLQVQEPWSDEGPWRDRNIAASPEGFSSAQFPLWARLPALFLRRSMNDAWFEPLVHIEGETLGIDALQSVTMTRVDPYEEIYVGEFTAPASGTLVLSVNDAVFLWYGGRGEFYASEPGRNRGTAVVTVSER